MGFTLVLSQIYSKSIFLNMIYGYIIFYIAMSDSYIPKDH